MKLIVHIIPQYIFISVIMVYNLIGWAIKPALSQFANNNYVATPDSLATQLANQILKEGGNAVDAGVAAMFALTVVEPYSSGLGGGGIMVIRLNNSVPPVVIDFREQAPINIDPKIFYSNEGNFDLYSSSGMKAICVPGFLAGAEKALQLYGTKTLAQVLSPIKRLAQSEIPVSKSLSYLISRNYDRIEADRVSSEIFSPDWIPLQVGDKMKREDIFSAFETMTENGSNIFYEGKIADAIVKLMDQQNGMIRLTDLATYEANIVSPLKLKYHEFKILAAPRPSIGGAILLDMLSILRHCDFTTIIPGSGRFIHLLIETQKRAVKNCIDQLYQGKKLTGSPPDVYNTNDILKWSKSIDSCQALPYKGRVLNFAEIGNAAHISVFDRQGNAVSITQTINQFFGSGVSLEDYGVLFNNSMNAFSWDAASPNAIESGKRPMTYMSPVIVLNNNLPYLVIGSNGGEYSIPVLAQIIIFLTEYGLSIDEALRLPRCSYNFVQHEIDMESRVEATAIEFLKDRGHQIRLFSKFDIKFGNVQAVFFNDINRKIVAQSDVRKEGIIYIP